MTRPARWTNPSVLELAGDGDPVEMVIAKARALVMRALEEGWSGPPYDVGILAQMLEIKMVPREDVRDARTVPGEGGKPLIEYNPTRPRGRVRYSIAHEIAHTLFPDWSKQVRNRAVPEEMAGDDWQLEALCNVAAAEFVMPIGSFTSLAEASFTIDPLLYDQRRFDVSMEALLIRAVHLRVEDVAMFCASPVTKGPNSGRYRIDYLIGSRAWRRGASLRGQLLPDPTVVADCGAIGFTAKGNEVWNGAAFRVEAVGIPPYPGSTTPRVVGVLIPTESPGNSKPNSVEYVRGDATRPGREGVRIIVQVVTDNARTWGGGGFATAMRRARPDAQAEFRDWATRSKNLRLGNVHLSSDRDEIRVASVVAQRGYGESTKPRIRYTALRDGLAKVATFARDYGATVHMPRIGCGMAGGSWDVVEELIGMTLGLAGVVATVYDLPGQERVEQSTLFGKEPLKS